MIEVYRFQTPPLASNCYVVKDKDTQSAIVIDPGHPRSRALEFIEKNSLTVEYVLLTHRHFDHVLGTAEFVRKTGAKATIHRLDAVGLESSKDSLFDNFVEYYGISQEIIRADILLNDGDVIDWSGRKIEVIHTSGHTSGGVCYIIEDCIFTGDTLFAGSIGRVDFPTGDSEQMKASLARLASLQGDYKVYSGHGESTTLDCERRNNIYMK